MPSGDFFHILRTATLILLSAIDNRLIVDFVSKLDSAFHKLLASVITVDFCFVVVKDCDQSISVAFALVQSAAIGFHDFMTLVAHHEHSIMVTVVTGAEHDDCL